MAKIFISHNSNDAKEAAALKRWLVDNGWDDTFLDIDAKDGLSPGERWKDALKNAADRCEAVLCLVSPAWLASAECRLEFRYAETLRKHLFLALVKPCNTQELPPDWQWCPLYGDGAQTTIRFDFREQATECSFLTEGLERLKIGLQKSGISAEHFPWPPENDPERAPYRGLKPLEAADAAVFFGRNAQVLHGMEALWDMHRNGIERMLVILGASGSGKSSFMRAGLLPRLARDDRQFFPLPVIRPRNAVMFGAEGLAPALTAALGQLGGKITLGEIEKWLHAGPEAFDALLLKLEQYLLDRIVGEADLQAPSIVLSIDQAEELFNPDGAAEAESFLVLLAGLLGDSDDAAGLGTRSGPSGRTIVVLTIRSDRYERLQTAPGLSSVKPRLFDLRPFPPGQFERVINGPAERTTQAGRNLTIDSRLTERLLTDFSEGADTLPLLGFALEKLYHKYGSDGDLTLEDYEAIRGSHETVQAAIFQETIDTALREPYRPPVIPAGRAEQEQGLRRAFIPFLARINPENNEPMRQVAKIAELPADVYPLVERLVEARLLIRDKDAIEVAHESLLRQWPKLHEWLIDDLDNLLLRDSIRRLADEWKKAGQRLDMLATQGERLTKAEALLATPGYVVAADSDERAYLNSCREAQQKRETEKREQHEREISNLKQIAEAQKNIVRRTRFGLVAVLLVAMLAGWQYFEARNRANLALARQLATESASMQLEPSWDALARSVLLAVESVNLTPTPQGLGALRNGVSLLPGPPEPVGGHIEEAWAVDATGKVVVGKEPDKIVVKRLPQGEEVGSLSKETCAALCVDVRAIAVSDAGKYLVIAGKSNARLFLLEGQSYVPTGIECVLAYKDGHISAIALSPDAHFIALVSGDSDAETTSLVGIDFVGGKCNDIELDMGNIMYPKAVAFSADGKFVSVGGRDFRTKMTGFAGLWLLPDLAQDTKPQTRRFDAETEILVEGSVEHIAVGQLSSKDGGTVQRLAAQISDGLNSHIRVWEVNKEGLQEVARLPEGERSLLGFLDGGSSLLIFYAPTKQVLAWPLSGPATWEGSINGEQAPKIAFGGPDNKLVTATWGSLDDTDALSISSWTVPGSPPVNSHWSREAWNLTDVSLETGDDPFALSPEGRFVLVALKDNMRSIIDIQAKKSIRTVSLPKIGLITALGPEARVIGYVEVSDRGDSVILVDPSGHISPRTKAFSGKIGAIAFSENGKQMVVTTGGDDAITTIVRLNLDSLTETARFNVDKPIATVAMNGDGTLMAVASKEALAGKSMVRVWRVPLPSAVGFLYQDKVPTLSYEVQAAEAIESIALSHDGTHLATASMPIEGVWPHLDLQVWSFARDALVREACRRIGRNLTPQEWATHIPGKPYKATCTAQALQTTSTALTGSLQPASTKDQAPGLTASPASPAESKQKPSLPAVAPHVSTPAQPPASAPATGQAAPGSASNSVALPQTENP